jgi:hypothetical protein
MAMQQDGRSIADLFGAFVNQLTTLFRKEVQLARTGISEKISNAVSGIGILVGGAALMIAALGILLQALAHWLIYFGMPGQWAYLVIGLVAALGGYLLIRAGMSSLAPENLSPTKTVDQLQRDAATAREQVA